MGKFKNLPPTILFFAGSNIGDSFYVYQVHLFLTYSIMKQASFSVVVMIMVLFSVQSMAQPGWRWGIGTTGYGTIFTEGMSMAIDKTGNVFCGGWVDMAGTYSADSAGVCRR